LHAGTRLLWQYRPTPFDGPIAYFKATGDRRVLDAVFPGAESTWGQLTSVSLDIHEVPGNHYTMFLDPEVRNLALLLRDYLAIDGSRKAPKAR
jgi:thioesterase domain-containing protein